MIIIQSQIEVGITRLCDEESSEWKKYKGIGGYGGCDIVLFGKGEKESKRVSVWYNFTVRESKK